MALKRLGSVLGTALRNAVNPAYLRALAQTTLSWGWAHQRRPLRQLKLSDLVTEPVDVRLRLMPRGTFGDTPVPDLMALCSLVRQAKPRTVFEFGTFRGLTTVQFAMNTEEATRIYTLDIPPADRSSLAEGGFDASVADAMVGELYRDSGYAGRVTQILCDSRKFDPEPYAGQMDFIFIDACHDYEFVRNDSEKALRMVSPRGIIAWHDYSAGFVGVRRYLEELASVREVCWVEGTYTAFARMG